jgi:hypothetical protein
VPKLKPTRSKLYLTLFLLFNIFFAYVLKGFFGIDIPAIIAGYPIAPHYSLFFLVIILSSYIFACIVTIKLPQFWQPTLLKILLALLFELILFLLVASLSIEIILNITDSIKDSWTISPSIGAQPPLNPCPMGLHIGICRNLIQPLNGRILLVMGYLVIVFVAYALSCLIMKVIKRGK